ncbi:unnamed protein product [Linum trigynum]|uniref:Uncharacterized protein n=1 Tax=Linum trigynum TaxID=586398 RepID=A0AAV2FYN3_9ROSI
MDIFSFIFQVSHDSGLIEGFYVDDAIRTDGVNHLLYADDAIVFCDATEDAVTHLAGALIWFQCVTGLKVNFGENFLFPVGDVDNIDRLAEILSCDWKLLHTDYLGLPLGAAPTASYIWNKVIDKVQIRLAGWKGKRLSMARRVVLCNSVLAAQPNYMFSLFKAPPSVISSIERLLRSFIWSGMGEDKKFHLVSWDKCKLPKQLGGLGITDLGIRNQALLIKWWWRYALERNVWWRQLIAQNFPNPFFPLVRWIS